MPSPIPFITLPTAVAPAAPNIEAPRKAYSLSSIFFLSDICGILTLNRSSISFGASFANFKIPKITTTIASNLINTDGSVVPGSPFVISHSVGLMFET